MMRATLRRLRTRWRRWQFLRAYSRVFTVRTGKSIGFSPLMSAYGQVEHDGLSEFEDGEVIWYWPEEGEYERGDWRL